MGKYPEYFYIRLCSLIKRKVIKKKKTAPFFLP